MLMLNYLWGFMLLIGIVYGTFTGNLSALTDAALDSAQEAVSLCITMLGVMSFWVGFMRIAENAGIIQAATRKMKPVLSFLFPNIPPEHPALESIATNMIANLFGLGWAATPAGLKAMEQLSTLNQKQGNAQTASNEMCTFLIINISSLQLIPLNIIAYRSQYGSVNPSLIVGPAIAATGVSTAVAVIFCKCMDRRRFR
jgi:spore maturation protein A